MLPKIIWFLWLQGLEEAPNIITTCLESWKIRNPDWKICVLSQKNLINFINLEHLPQIIHAQDFPREALSDIIRIALLDKCGGVWVDSTLYCAASLDDWLEQEMDSGFFAFSSPGPDRMLSSWFLAAEKGNHIVKVWKDKTIKYWKVHREPHHYFWFHYLFSEAYDNNSEFRNIWDRVPTVFADGPHYFIPYNERFKQNITDKDKAIINNADIPVFKLTHKLETYRPEPDSVLEYLLDSANAISKLNNEKDILLKTKKAALVKARTKIKNTTNILVTWYGSFLGHGTIGDLLSVRAVSNHLVRKGYNVYTASAEPFDNLGGIIVDWQSVSPSNVDAMVFVCGPILKKHPLTPQLFSRFESCKKLGIGVSLFPGEHFNFINPFDVVLAREGTPNNFEDVALASPPNHLRRPKIIKAQNVTIGISLRERQGEYGLDNCLDEKTKDMVNNAAARIVSERNGRIIYIENHLQRSGVSPERIQEKYAECDLIITSRFHGAMLAIDKMVPFIAIDQIKGSAKVYNMLKRKSWPHIYRADQINTENIIDSATEIFEKRDRGVLYAIKKDSVKLAFDSLNQLDKELENIFI